MPSTHLVLCHPLLLPPSVFPSIRGFSNESALRITWPKYWSFNFSISPSNEYSGLISFRIDWFDLLAVQETLKSLLQHHSLKASILQCSAFFMVQLSHPYMTTGKTIALTRWTFVDKVMSLLFNTLFTFVIAFLPRSKHLLISWLQSPSAVIWEPKKIKSVTVSLYFLIKSFIPSTLGILSSAAASLQQETCQVGLARILLTLDVSFFLKIYHPLTPTVLLGYKFPLVLVVLWGKLISLPYCNPPPPKCSGLSQIKSSCCLSWASLVAQIVSLTSVMNNSLTQNDIFHAFFSNFQILSSPLALSWSPWLTLCSLDLWGISSSF